jgi:uncharacterized protein (DUF2384 family)
MTSAISTWTNQQAVVGWGLVAFFLLLGIVLREFERRKRKPEIHLPPRRGLRVLTVAQLWRAAKRAEVKRFDVRDFGAKGDDVTDDRPAIQVTVRAAGDWRGET